jgi:hypothetical protein
MTLTQLEKLEKLLSLIGGWKVKRSPASYTRASNGSLKVEILPGILSFIIPPDTAKGK